MARDVGGKLKFLGDKTTISTLKLDGVPDKMANDFAIAGCTSPIVGGCCYNVPGGIISVPTILELALNNGVQRLTGVKLGCDTGNAEEFTTYEQVWEAFCKQVSYVIPFCHEIKNADKEVFATYFPSSVQSALSEVYIENGKDIICGGTKPYLWYAMSLAGMPNVGDALAAMKKFIFEKKTNYHGTVVTCSGNKF